MISIWHSFNFVETLFMLEPYIIIEPKAPVVPLIISVPHCGTSFPEELSDYFVDSKKAAPDDTDWYVHDLYNFASELGITIIHARYSRWVIDLNRTPDSEPLYNDGRIITALTPATDFFGDDIYVSSDAIPDQIETERRLEKYYWPYYNKLEELLESRLNSFGKVLLWDAHSIRHHVPTIRKDIFPDMILGDNDEKSAHKSLIDTAFNNLQNGPYHVNHNNPFKGGHITRYFGNPDRNIHALQLEMNKILYMNDEEKQFSEGRADQVRAILKPTFWSLINELNNL